MTCCQPPIVRRWICRQDGEVLAQGLLWMEAQAWLWSLSSILVADRPDWRFPAFWLYKLVTYPTSAGRLLWEIIILGFPDRSILLMWKLHYTVSSRYYRQSPRCDSNLGELERYRLVTIRGGERDWHPSPHYKWVIYRIPGWHYSAGVLLLAGGVILSAEGVPLSGHIEFPCHIILQVSFCFLVTCLGHCEYSPVSWRCPFVWTPKFSWPSVNHNLDGHLNFLELSWMRHHHAPGSMSISYVLCSTFVFG